MKHLFCMKHVWNIILFNIIFNIKDHFSTFVQPNIDPPRCAMATTSAPSSWTGSTAAPRPAPSRRTSCAFGPAFPWSQKRRSRTVQRKGGKNWKVMIWSDLNVLVYGCLWWKTVNSYGIFLGDLKLVDFEKRVRHELRRMVEICITLILMMMTTMTTMKIPVILAEIAKLSPMNNDDSDINFRVAIGTPPRLT